MRFASFPCVAARGGLGLLAGAWLMWSLLGASQACAQEFTIKVQLIWGTDITKPYDASLRKLDDRLKEKLTKVFRQRYFFEVDRQVIHVPVNGSKLTSLSHQCVIEAQHLGGENFKVSLYGEGKLVSSVRQTMAKDHYLTLAGDIKKKENETWIVALSREAP